MDVDAEGILEGKATLEEVGEDIRNMDLAVAQGSKTNSKDLGHQEFNIKYNSFAPLIPDYPPI